MNSFLSVRQKKAKKAKTAPKSNIEIFDQTPSKTTTETYTSTSSKITSTKKSSEKNTSSKISKYDRQDKLEKSEKIIVTEPSKFDHSKVLKNVDKLLNRKNQDNIEKNIVRRLPKFKTSRNQINSKSLTTTRKNKNLNEKYQSSKDNENDTLMVTKNEISSNEKTEKTNKISNRKFFDIIDNIQNEQKSELKVIQLTAPENKKDKCPYRRKILCESDTKIGKRPPLLRSRSDISETPKSGRSNFVWVTNGPIISPTVTEHVFTTTKNIQLLTPVRRRKIGENVVIKNHQLKTPTETSRTPITVDLKFSESSRSESTQITSIKTTIFKSKSTRISPTMSSAMKSGSEILSTSSTISNLKRPQISTTEVHKSLNVTTAFPKSTPFDLISRTSSNPRKKLETSQTGPSSVVLPKSFYSKLSARMKQVFAKVKSNNANRFYEVCKSILHVKSILRSELGVRYYPTAPTPFCRISHM